MNKLKNILVAAALVAPAATWAVEALPFSTTFSTQEEFDAWTSKAGPDAEVTTPWSYQYTSFSGGRAQFDYAEGFKEDNYFISPELEFDGAGAYKIELKYAVTGSLFVLLGTDIDDLSTFNQEIGRFEDVDCWGISEDAEFTFEVKNAGTYYLAFHAATESGSSSGHRIYEVKITSDKAVPALVTDIKAKADANDGLEVVLSWTNPSETTAGTDVDAITKVVVMRNGEELDTITDGMTPGSQATYTDTPDEAGEYTYSVVVYDANGCCSDDPMEASAGYVGKPVAEFPYSFTYSEYEPTLPMFTRLDADGDGTNFELDDSWYFKEAFISTNEDTADNYLASPYIHLAPGYYLFTTQVTAMGNSVEFGVATNRHDIPGTFVKCFELVEYQQGGFHEQQIVIVIEEEGDYCLVWHHTGTSASSYYNEVKVKSASLETAEVLPGVATGLTAYAAPASMDVDLAWINPDKDNAGKALASISKVEILLGDEVLDTVTEGLVPGEESSCTVTVEESGVLTFSVVVYNENGCSTEDAPTVTLFVGTGEKMPYTADFSQWTKITEEDAWDRWSTDVNGAAVYDCYFDDEPSSGFHSPYLLMTSENTYKVTFTTFGKEDDHGADFELHAGLESDNMNHVKDFSHSGTDEQTHTVLLKPTDAAAQAEDEEEAIAIPAGNVKLGLHSTNKGTVYIKDFKVGQNNIQTGIENVATDSAATLVCIDGVVMFGYGMTDVVVSDLTGRTLYHSSAAPESLDLRALGATGIVIVSARSASGNPATAKIAL